MKTYKHLYEQLISEDNIYTAIMNACKHKLGRKDFRHLHDHPEEYIQWFQEQIENFKNDFHTPIEIYDGVQRKRRIIIVPSLREQVVHHMIVNVLKPIFLKPMYEHSYGSIPGRGAHDAKNHIAKFIRNHPNDVTYCFKGDIRKYFNSIPHDILIARLRQIIKDEKFMNVVEEIINVTDVGIPLGFYLSQWIANWYLTEMDHFIKEELKAVAYYRYMDDIVIFDHSKEKLAYIKNCICDQLEKLGLHMKDNWQIFEFHHVEFVDKKYTNKGRFLDFMGFRFYRDKVTLRRSIYKKACRKARRIHRKDRPTLHDARQMMSYKGWFESTNTNKAFNKYVSPYINYNYLSWIISHAERRRNYELEEKRKHSLSRTCRSYSIQNNCVCA